MWCASTRNWSQFPQLLPIAWGGRSAGLRQDNFIIYEDGQKQTIANFGTTEAPFEIALLLDTSGSTRADVDLIRQAANAFINALRPGDRVAIVAFKDHGKRQFDRWPPSMCWPD